MIIAKYRRYLIDILLETIHQARYRAAFVVAIAILRRVLWDLPFVVSELLATSVFSFALSDLSLVPGDLSFAPVRRERFIVFAQGIIVAAWPGTQCPSPLGHIASKKPWPSISFSGILRYIPPQSKPSISHRFTVTSNKSPTRVCCEQFSRSLWQTWSRCHGHQVDRQDAPICNRTQRKTMNCISKGVCF